MHSGHLSTKSTRTLHLPEPRYVGVDVQLGAWLMLIYYRSQPHSSCHACSWQNPQVSGFCLGTFSSPGLRTHVDHVMALADSSRHCHSLKVDQGQAAPRRGGLMESLGLEVRLLLLSWARVEIVWHVPPSYQYWLKYPCAWFPIATLLQADALCACHIYNKKY